MDSQPDLAGAQGAPAGPSGPPPPPRRKSLKSRFVFLVTALIAIIMALNTVVLFARERSARLVSEQDLLILTGLLLFVTLSFGFFMSKFLAGIILKPLNQFAGAARQVAAGEDPHPLDVRADDEIADLAESFNKMTVRLKEKRELESKLYHQDKLATVGQLAAAVAHEVRNPLVSIRSLAELLADDFRGGEQARHLEVMIREVDRINAVIERLLNYARPRKKTAEVFDPADVIGDMVILVKPQARKRDVKLRPDLGHRGSIRICRDDLAQITLNLLMNALAAIEGGGSVVIETRDAGKSVQLRFIDDGRGMDRDELARIFRPFFTASVGGTGLGLTIVEQLVRENGGTIAAESTPGAGTVFTILFPTHFDKV